MFMLKNIFSFIQEAMKLREVHMNQKRENDKYHVGLGSI